MAMTIYRSSDVDAPVLTTSPGSLIALLDACLRTGYGTKAGAGWTKPFTGANIAVFRQGPGGNGRCLRVWNARTGTDAANNYSAHLRGYEAMTAVSTGTGPFPTTAQIPGNGLWCPYRHLPSLGATPWMIRATANWFDVFVDLYPAVNNPTNGAFENYFAFGSFPSFKTGDTYNEYICGGSYEGGRTSMNVSADDNLYITREDTGAGGSIAARFIPAAFVEETYLGAGDAKYKYPNRPDNAALMHPYLLFSTGQVRGRAPGLWGLAAGSMHLGYGNTFDGQGELAGKVFEVHGKIGEGAAPIAEISDTFW